MFAEPNVGLDTLNVMALYQNIVEKKAIRINDALEHGFAAIGGSKDARTSLADPDRAFGARKVNRLPKPWERGDKGLPSFAYPKRRATSS